MLHYVQHDSETRLNSQLLSAAVYFPTAAYFLLAHSIGKAGMFVKSVGEEPENPQQAEGSKQ